MSEIIFTKLSGAGNDFVLLDADLNQNLAISPDLIKNLCDRRFGIGADGLLVIKNVQNADFEMKYYNSDGSTGMLCGNGARCIIKYADSSGRIKDSHTKFIFQSNLYSGEVNSDDLITFNLNPPTDINEKIEVRVLDQLFSASFINTGAHHVIIDLEEQKFSDEKLKELESFPVEKFGKEIRYSEQFAPSGTNVNFISCDGEYINIRTYERGVEKETLACGTGSVGASIISILKHKVETPVTIKTKSGELLNIDFDIVTKNRVENVKLTGPAKIVFEGKININ